MSPIFFILTFIHAQIASRRLFKSSGNLVAKRPEGNVDVENFRKQWKADANVFSAKRRLVAKRPRRDIKVYVYNLGEQWKSDTIVHTLETFHSTNWNQSNCGWNKHVCKEKEWHREYSTFRQYGADVTIIEKFKHYDNIVTDPREADIFLVPYPHGSHCRAPPRGHHWWPHCGSVDSKIVQALIDSLTYLDEKTKFRHLFLLTGDWSNNNPLLEDMPLYVTLGGAPNKYGNHPLPQYVTNIVVPPPVLEPEYQPSVLAQTNWTRHRNYSVYMNAGLVNSMRWQVHKVLMLTSSVGGLPTMQTQIEGHRKFSLPPSKIWENYRNTVFCPVIKGDLPFQKRFYDVALSGCLPVVLAQWGWDTDKTGCYSWWNKKQPNYVTTHPFARGGRTRRRGMSIDYRDFVVEVSGGPQNMIPTLEKLMRDKKKLHAMQEALGRHARKLVYGLDDDMYAEGDAFDELLGQLRHYLDRLQSKKPWEQINCSKT